MRRIAVSLLVLAAVTATAADDRAAEAAARRMGEAADACLVDVSDRRIPYGRSHNCTVRLSAASKAYFATGAKLTYSDATSIPRHAYLAMSAKSVAWSAAALSNAGHRNEVPIFHLGIW